MGGIVQLEDEQAAGKLEIADVVEIEDKVLQAFAVEDEETAGLAGVAGRLALRADEHGALHVGPLPLRARLECVDDSIGGDGQNGGDAREVAPQDAEVKFGVRPARQSSRLRGGMGSHVLLDGVGLVIGGGRRELLLMLLVLALMLLLLLMLMLLLLLLSSCLVLELA